MKKLLLMVYLYILYVIAVPVLVVIWIVTMGIMLVNNLRDFKKLYFKETVRDCTAAVVAGFKHGHKINMYSLECACNKELANKFPGE